MAKIRRRLVMTDCHHFVLRIFSAIVPIASWFSTWRAPRLFLLVPETQVQRYCPLMGGHCGAMDKVPDNKPPHKRHPLWGTDLALYSFLLRAIPSGESNRYKIARRALLLIATHPYSTLSILRRSFLYCRVPSGRRGCVAVRHRTAPSACTVLLIVSPLRGEYQQLTY